MHASRFIPSLLLLLLSAWPGGVSSAPAAQRIAAPAVTERALTDARAGQTGSLASVAQAGSQQPARGSQGRILFILASSKVHGTSALPASISFGEVVNAWDTFQAAGYAVDFVSPEGGAVPILDSYVGKDMQPRLKDESIMNGLRNTATPAQIDASRYRAVYYVGGSNAMYGVAEHPLLQNIAMQVYERHGGVISAVCHGTAGIVNLKLASGHHLVSGKRISGFPEEHEEQDAAYFKQFPFLIRKTVESRGGSFHVVNNDAPHIEVDGRLVTGQNYASATPVAKAVVEVLRQLAEPQPKPGTAKG
ncbi:putative intracellular protease/amidase [Tahibacter aquaticus]|uniref:Putative intracellular protease/amidase n=1 Tax=Tahibacter aquaticus TaxID=520092 RepID=A0A4R6Z6M2_9GAMM|nr:type 1 glutamine amidotransferase domain-containing protein [Tahibacter aquaticus]TDR47382.1 putative intracellular protease/amidase [Tahibacter aquaticus]